MVIKKFVVPLLELPMIGGGEVVEGLAHPVLLLRQVPAWGGAEERAPRRRRSPEPDSLGAAREEEEQEQEGNAGSGGTRPRHRRTPVS